MGAVSDTVTLLGDASHSKLPDPRTLAVFPSLIRNVPRALGMGLFYPCIHWGWAP